MKKFIEEFKTFALRGNMMDMAVGVIIGGAFSNLVTSLTNNFIYPILNFFHRRRNLHPEGYRRILFFFYFFSGQFPDYGFRIILSSESNQQADIPRTQGSACRS